MTSSRGLTLLEVTVAGAIFAVMLTAVVLIERSFTRSNRQEDTQSEAFRAAALAWEQVRRELRGATVVPGTSLDYYPVERAGDAVMLGPSGAAETQDLAHLEMAPNGDLVRTQNGQTRVLAHLGEEGAAAFELVRPELLRVTLHAQRKNSVYDLSVHLALPNQN